MYILRSFNKDYVQCYGTSFYDEKNKYLKLVGEHKIIFSLNNLIFLSGKYYISVGIYKNNSELLDEIQFAKEFTMHSEYDMKETGIFHLDHSWDIGNIHIIED